MATLKRTFEVNRESRKVKNTAQLYFSVDGILSNPINKRYRELFENRLNLKQLFEKMTVNLKDTDRVRISNGTKTVEFTVKDWINVIDINLKLYNDNPESDDRNVWIKVSGKISAKEDSEVDTL